MEMKMTPKDGVDLTTVDLMNIKKIKKRIADKKWEGKNEIKALREFIDFEKTYKEELDEKLAELEAKVNYITSGLELQQGKIDREEEGLRSYIVQKFKSKPEIDYTAQPIPVPPAIKSFEPKHKYEMESEIKTSGLSEIEYKTPEEILAEKSEKLIEDMKIVKQKLKKAMKNLDTPSLFQNLTQKSEEITEETSTTVLPFVATKKIEPEEPSKLRIIPNVEDIEAQPSGFMQVTQPLSKKQKETSRELVVCKQCGAILSLDYAYCNKCGAKLTSKRDGNRALNSKFQGKIKVKTKADSFSVEDEIIYLKDEEEYVKFLGITSKERTPLFNNNHRYNYLIELTNNLDYIATSILGGELDKMLLITSNNIEEKCHFYVKDNLIYIVYGVFPDKKGKWMLEQMAKYYSELVREKEVDKLPKLEKRNINHKFKGLLKFMLNEYLGLQEVFTDQEIPYLEDWIRVDYVGLSSMSIGVISLLLDEEGNLNVEMPGEYDNLAEEIEMKESLLTAKIEAIAANTLGNTGSYPRWIAVKLGFQKYRFLTFKRYQHNYFLSSISEGNLKKIELVEKKIEPYLYYGIDAPFAGNLRPFNKLKASVKDVINKIPGRKFK